MSERSCDIIGAQLASVVKITVIWNTLFREPNIIIFMFFLQNIRTKSGRSRNKQ